MDSTDGQALSESFSRQRTNSLFIDVDDDIHGDDVELQYFNDDHYDFDQLSAEEIFTALSEQSTMHAQPEDYVDMINPVDADAREQDELDYDFNNLSVEEIMAALDTDGQVESADEVRQSEEVARKSPHRGTREAIRSRSKQFLKPRKSRVPSSVVSAPSKRTATKSRSPLRPGDDVEPAKR